MVVKARLNEQNQVVLPVRVQHRAFACCATNVTRIIISWAGNTFQRVVNQEPLYFYDKFHAHHNFIAAKDDTNHVHAATCNTAKMRDKMHSLVARIVFMISLSLIC